MFRYHLKLLLLTISFFSNYLYADGTNILTGRFNVERTDSASFLPIMTNERNAWYTQIVGRDFDYSLVFYEDDFLAEKNVSNVTVKIDLMDMDTVPPTSLYRYVYHFPDTFIGSRKAFSLPLDLASLPATKNARFKVTYGVDIAGNVVQANCGQDASLCSQYRLDDAKDNFAIRPEKFYVSVADGTKERINSNTPSDKNFAAGYDYNLSIRAIKFIQNYPGFVPADGYNTNGNRTLKFSTIGTCHDNSDVNNSIDFNNGIHNDATFSHPNVGEYKLNITQDSNWTDVDQNGRDCIQNNTSTSGDFNSISGCNIAQVDNLTINFQPEHFEVSLLLETLPNSGHPDFIYMSELNSTYNKVAVQFIGEVVAKNENNDTTTNFTSSCVAKNMLLDLNATSSSVEGVNQLIKTIGGTTVNFSRHIVYNADSSTPSFETNTALPSINNALTIAPNKFLNENNGSVHLDMRYNVNKHSTEPINPIEVTFNSMEASSTASTSQAHDKSNTTSTLHTPRGFTTFPNNIKNFYFARVVSDLNNYPRANITISTLVRTPLNVDIYCQTDIRNYCQDRLIDANTRMSGTTREAHGWYLSVKHNAQLDGNVTSLVDNPDIVDISPDPTNSITLGNGENGLVLVNFTSCPTATPSSIITINSSPALAFEPSQYIVNCTDANASQWSGSGQTGNILKIKPKANPTRKMDW